MQRPPTVLSHSVVAELQTSPMVVYDLGFVGMVAWAGKLANELNSKKKFVRAFVRLIRATRQAPYTFLQVFVR